MRVVVAGGTGLVGHHVVHCLAEAGHDPVVVARSNAVDLAIGEGLDAAMAGSEAVIDATNAESVNLSGAPVGGYYWAMASV